MGISLNDVVVIIENHAFSAAFGLVGGIILDRVFIFAWQENFKTKKSLIFQLPRLINILEQVIKDGKNKIIDINDLSFIKPVISKKDRIIFEQSLAVVRKFNSLPRYNDAKIVAEAESFFVNNAVPELKILISLLKKYE